MPEIATHPAKKKVYRRGDPTAPVTISLPRTVLAVLDEQAGRLQRSRFILETLEARFRADAAPTAPSH